MTVHINQTTLIILPNIATVHPGYLAPSCILVHHYRALRVQHRGDTSKTKTFFNAAFHIDARWWCTVMHHFDGWWWCTLMQVMVHHFDARWWCTLKQGVMCRPLHIVRSHAYFSECGCSCSQLTIRQLQFYRTNCRLWRLYLLFCHFFNKVKLIWNSYSGLESYYLYIGKAFSAPPY